MSYSTMIYRDKDGRYRTTIPPQDDGTSYETPLLAWSSVTRENPVSRNHAGKPHFLEVFDAQGAVLLAELRWGSSVASVLPRSVPPNATARVYELDSGRSSQFAIRSTDDSSYRPLLRRLQSELHNQRLSHALRALRRYDKDLNRTDFFELLRFGLGIPRDPACKVLRWEPDADLPDDDFSDADIDAHLDVDVRARLNQEIKKRSGLK